MRYLKLTIQRQPAANPARSSCSCSCSGSPCSVLLFFFLARPLVNPTGL